MLTKARILGHPIHPMLVAFPVTMYVATLVALIVSGATHDMFWYRAAFWTNLAGVVTAAIAAVPGFIDFLGLPKKSRARATGLRHAGSNVLALVLFVISVALIGRSLLGRAPGARIDVAAPLVLSIIGCAFTVLAGWLGWKLVQTHHVGIKPTTHAAGAEAYADIDDLDELVATPTMPAQTAAPMTH
jgi:uncharacterized membrane protein